jgi:hypothetical protein
VAKKWIIGLVLLLAVPGGWLAWTSPQGWTEARLERLIRAEVAAGSDRAQVEDRLNRHSIKHAYFINNADHEYYMGFARDAGLRKEDLSGVLKGNVGPANEGWILRSEIEVFFFFDRQGRLAGHFVEVWFDCL